MSGSLNGFDYMLMGLVGLSVLLGFWRGLLSEIVALGAWLLAFMVAKAFMGEALPFVSSWVREPALRAPAAFLAVFVLVLIAVALLRWTVSELIRAAGLGAVDRFLGACFGLARGGLIVFVVAMLVGLGGFANELWWRDARFSAPLETAVLAAKPWLPELLVKRIRYR